ncbi:MAG TPA: DUF3048 domain-containing protein [Anaerolineaceae bacterium]|nr:DUF3048 domain-containing protein [Anaerolineaceae bacterium]
MGLRQAGILGFVFLALLSGCTFPTGKGLQTGDVNATAQIPTAPAPISPLESPVIPAATEVLSSRIPITGASEVLLTRVDQEILSSLNPLTGLLVSDPSKLNRRPVLTKISNFPPEGRPHAGLSLADIVFEYYIGEYMNRFLALYYSQDTPKAWPLRSGRLIDAQLTNLFGGILVYGNADPRVETIITRDLYNRAIPFKLAGCPPVCGEETHSATGVWVDTAAITEWADSHEMDNLRPDLTNLVFNAAPPSGGILVNTVDVNYIEWNRGQWRYDPGRGQYLRYIESWDETKTYPLIPLIDQVTNQQVNYSNVVILFAEYIEYSPTYHDAVLWDNSTGKRAIYFRDGMMYEGTWMTVDNQKPFLLLDSHNQPMRLKPGTTWFIIAGISSTFSPVSDDQYSLLFAIP